MKKRSSLLSQEFEDRRKQGKMEKAKGKSVGNSLNAIRNTLYTIHDTRYAIRAASHGDFFGIFLTNYKMVRIIVNKLNIEYENQENL